MLASSILSVYFPIQNLESPSFQWSVTIEGHIRDKFAQTNNNSYKFTDFIKMNKI